MYRGINLYRITEHTPERLSLVQNRIYQLIGWSAVGIGLAGLIAALVIALDMEIELGQAGSWLTPNLLIMSLGILTLVTFRHRAPELHFEHSLRLLKLTHRQGHSVTLPYRRFVEARVFEIRSGEHIYLQLQLLSADGLMLPLLHGQQDALKALADELNDAIGRDGNEASESLPEPESVHLENHKNSLRAHWQGQAVWPLMVWKRGQATRLLSWNEEGLRWQGRLLTGRLCFYWNADAYHLIVLSQAGETAWLASQRINPSNPPEQLLKQVDAANWMRIDLNELSTVDILLFREHLLAWQEKSGLKI